MKRIIKKVFLVVAAVFLSCTFLAPVANSFAEGGYGLIMSPMNRTIVLNAGEVYRGSFNISNPHDNPYDFSYEISAEPFYVDENYNIYYDKDKADTYNEIVDWIDLNTTKGVIAPNETQTIRFSINVPFNAPSGGQYASIIVRSVDDDTTSESDGMGININQKIAIAHIIYAEIAGTTHKSGDITDVNVPSFILSGDIKGTSSIRNTGNTHGNAKYTLQVFPLFSDEEIYTNEENPGSASLLPNRTFYNETVWEDTPWFGIFNVVYTVEFEGLTSQVKKLVIVCPIWLLFIIIFVIALVIIWLVTRGKKKSKSRADY